MTRRLPSGFNRLAGSNLAAQSAEQIALGAMPMVAVLSLHTDASTASWLQVALTLPFVLFAIPDGMLADRWPKRTLMAGAEAVRTAALLVVAGLLASSHLNLTALGGLGFVAVCGTVMFSVAALAGFTLQLLCILQSQAVRLARQPLADDGGAVLKPA